MSARILAFATKGHGSNDEARIAELLGDHEVVLFPFERADKGGNVLRLLRTARRERPALIVMEGTGLAGGVAVLLARALLRIPFVVSSGDAVGPFLAGLHPVLKLPGWAYERLLYRAGAGFVGWTPYLVGRALTMGARRGVTAPGFAQHPEPTAGREEVRRRLGIPADALVFGIAGSLAWSATKGYCYGLELVQALRRTRRANLAVLVIGDGDGLPRLRELAGDELGRRAFLPGAVPAAEVATYLDAVDVASLPQSLDQVGAMRYTTKISEYLAARLPIVTGRLPVAYDLVQEWSWRLPGDAPWAEKYVCALAGLMERVTPSEVAARRATLPSGLAAFDRAEQRRRVGAFVDELVTDLGQRTDIAR